MSWSADEPAVLHCNEINYWPMRLTADSENMPELLSRNVKIFKALLKDMRQNYTKVYNTLVQEDKNDVAITPIWE